MTTSRPSIAELRKVTQAGVTERRSAEHWAGRLYMRALSTYVTRWLIATPVTADALTLAMIVVGLIGAAVLAFPGLPSAAVAALLIQLYLLLDCVDGEVARWRRATSATGVYLDRLGHHVVESALVVALGFRVAGGPSTDASGWMVLGAVTALLVILGKLAGDLIVVARVGAGLPTGSASGAQTDRASSIAGVRGLRRMFTYLPIHRMVGAIELSLFVVVAALIDQVRGDPLASQVLLTVTAAVALMVAVGHPLAIVTSKRLT